MTRYRIELVDHIERDAFPAYGPPRDPRVTTCCNDDLDVIDINEIEDAITAARTPHITVDDARTILDTLNTSTDPHATLASILRRGTLAPPAA